MASLSGKVALISGSGRGIGRAVAEKFARAGARLVVNDLDVEVAEEAAEAIRRLETEALAVPGDVTKPGFAENFVQAAVDTFGGIDIIVNNAGYSWDAVLHRTSDEQWEAMLDVHLTAPFRILRAAQPFVAAAAQAELAGGKPMSRRSVVNISSIAGSGGNIGQAGYATGKAGIIGLTRTVAKEWSRIGVTVNAVSFGIIDTRMTQIGKGKTTIKVGDREIRAGMSETLQAGIASSVPMGRAGTREEAAGAIYLLCLEEASYITGAVLDCTGGFSI
jgi:3-oxoacyl-[acyl-carrier protein] reductase